MDTSGQPSVQGSSEQLQQQNQLQRPTDDNILHQTSRLDTVSSTSNTQQDISSFNAQTPSIAINSSKDLPLVASQFSMPPLPTSLSAGESASPGTRASPNPALQVSVHPMDHPQDAPVDYSMLRQQDDDGPPPAQRRKLNPLEKQDQALKSEEESDSRRASASKGAMSYDPVHEHHQSTHSQHHARRPSSANSQRSHLSSYSAQSSNAEADGPTSPNTGDQAMSRDGKKRKHKCPECGQYFTRLHNLKSHLLTHSQEKPFICQECGHKFRRLHDLKRHHKLHTGERPYTCPGCNRSFARMDALNRHRKPGGECASHNMSTSSASGSQSAVERRMSLPPGFGRPPSSQGSTSPMPQPGYSTSDAGINPALATASHIHSYPPTHLPPKQKHRYHDSGDRSPGLLAPPASSTHFGRSPPPQAFGHERGVQPPPLMIPSPATSGPALSPIQSHHHSGSTHAGSGSSGSRSAPTDVRSPIPPMMDQVAPPYSLTESPRGMTPPPLQAPPPLAVPPPSLPLLPSPGSLISPSPRNSYDRASNRQSLDTGRTSDGSRTYLDALIERNGRLEERVKQLETIVDILWRDRENTIRAQTLEDSRSLS